MGGRTRGTLSGNVSEATAEIRLDFPVPLSPATATRRLLHFSFNNIDRYLHTRRRSNFLKENYERMS